MSKKGLLVGISVSLALGIFFTSASAQVGGDLIFDIWMWPQTTASEMSPLDIDSETWLNLKVELSGLSFSNRVAMGIAGIEHYIADLKTALGPLELEDELAFAVPYIECPSYMPFKFMTIDFFAAYRGFDKCRPIGDLLFVSKRGKVDISFKGLTFSTLIILEDVNFPNPTAEATDGLPANPAYIYDDNYQTQAFRLGAIVELSGTTASGVRVTSKTGFCARWDITIFTGFWGKYFNMKGLEWGPAKYIKKHAWYEEVCIDPKLESTKEYIAMEGLSPFEGLTLNLYLLFKPDLSQGLEGYLNFNLNLFDMGRLNGFLKFTGPEGIQLEPASWGLPGLGSPFIELYLLDNLTLIWEDVDADLAVDRADMITTSLSVPFQGVWFLLMNQFVPTVGLVRLLLEADLSPLEVTALWERGTWPAWDGVLKFSKIDFKWKEVMNERLEFGIDALFDALGLSAINIRLKVGLAP
ncbi:TPA: hypothetical protein EYP37_04440 [Candidatus Poribacteria bacterium]|nr:hypothetical protein [Candidatus Poribacteria bacterium]